MPVPTLTPSERTAPNPVKAFEIVRELGLEGGRVSVAQWRPDERELDRAVRPDKSAALKATHQAAALLRTLNDRIAAADAPGAVWHDAGDVLAELLTASIFRRNLASAVFERGNRSRP